MNSDRTEPGGKRRTGRPCGCLLKYAWLNLNLRYFPFPRLHGGRSSTVEPRIVVPAVAGSNPVGHPLNRSFLGNPPEKTSKYSDRRNRSIGDIAGVRKPDWMKIFAIVIEDRHHEMFARWPIRFFVHPRRRSRIVSELLIAAVQPIPLFSLRINCGGRYRPALRIHTLTLVGPLPCPQPLPTPLY